MVPPWFAAPLRPQGRTIIHPAEDNGRIPSPPTCHNGFNGKLQGEFHRQAVSPLSAYAGLSGHRHDPATRLDHRFCGIIESVHKDCQGKKQNKSNSQFIIHNSELLVLCAMNKPLCAHCHFDQGRRPRGEISSGDVNLQVIGTAVYHSWAYAFLPINGIIRQLRTMEAGHETEADRTQD